MNNRRRQSPRSPGRVPSPFLPNMPSPRLSAPLRMSQMPQLTTLTTPLSSFKRLPMTSPVALGGRSNNNVRQPSNAKNLLLGNSNGTNNNRRNNNKNNTSRNTNDVLNQLLNQVTTPTRANKRAYSNSANNSVLNNLTAASSSKLNNTVQNKASGSNGSPFSRLNFSYNGGANKNNVTSSNNNARPIISYGNGRIMNNNFAQKPALPLPQMACSNALKTGVEGGLRSTAFRDCFIKYLTSQVSPIISTSNAAVGNTAKMDDMCTQASLSPHQIVVYETAKVMANVEPEKLGGHRGLLVWHNTGSGKCYARDTPILMYDGTVKMVQDVLPGDLVMGDDSTPRVVKGLARGSEEMFSVLPRTKRNASPGIAKELGFTCNASHILVLQYMKHKTVKNLRNGKVVCTYALDNTIRESEMDGNDMQKFLMTIPDDPTLEMTVREYLNLPEGVKAQLHMFSSGPVEFPYVDEPSFDPWVLGAWLGDGTSARPEFTWKDEELTEVLKKKVAFYGCTVTESGLTVRVTTRKKQENPFTEVLREYDMLGNKHIPHILKTGSIETREALLAGLLDTDGHLRGQRFEIVQKNQDLARDIVFVARSLGLRSTIVPVQKSCVYNGSRRSGTYYRVFISGRDLYRLPTVLERKQVADPGKNGRSHQSSFKFDLIPQGIGEYYGFSVDGNHRYLLGNFVVAHNSITSLGVIMAFWPTEKKIVLVSSKVNTAQAIETYKREAPRFFPNEFRAIAAEYKKRKRAEHLSDKEAFDDALKDRVIGLTFVEARNRIAAAQGEFKTIKDMKLYGGPGSVLIIDEAQGLAMKTRGDPNGDAIKLGCALRAMSREKMSKIHVFAMTATPGNSIREWMKLLSVVRRSDQPPLTIDDSGGTNGKGRPLCEPKRLSPKSGGIDWASVIEKDLSKGSLAFYDKLSRVLFGLFSYVDIRTDRSRHACVSQREMKMQLDRYYFLLMLRSNAQDRRMVKSASDKAQHQYDPRFPDAYLKKMRLLGHSLPKTMWSTLPKHVQEELFRRRRILKVDSRSEGRYVSNKLVAMAQSVAKLPGKQYIYTVSGNEFILAAALNRWYGMTDVTKKSETFDGAYLNKNTKKVVGISKGNNFVVLNDATRKDHKERITQIFNSEANSDGSYIRVVIATGQLYEGLDLAGLRYVHLDPMPSPLHEIQAVGRGVRNCSHRFLPLADRKVTIVRWFAAAPEGGWSALESLLSTMRGMKGRIGPDELKEEYDRLNAGNPGGRPRGYDEFVFDRSRNDPSVKMLWNFERVAKSLAIDCQVLNRYSPGIVCGKPPKLMETAEFSPPGASCG